MQDELKELLEAAMYKEIASEAFYVAGQQNTSDKGARVLMEELAAEEARHLQFLKALKDSDWPSGEYKYKKEKVPDLKISEYLTGPDKLEGAGLQDTLAFAVKREKQAIEFYFGMLNILQSGEAKALCERLAQEEMKHKQKLEVLYDTLFYGED